MKCGSEFIMKNKILPINKEPLLHSYTHYSEAMAIITNPSMYEETDLIFNNLTNFNSTNENIINFNCDPIIKQTDYKYLNFDSIKDTKDKFIYLYSKVNGNGEYIIEIKSQKIINIAAECGIMLTEMLPEENNIYPNNLYKIFYCGAKKLRSMFKTHDMEQFINYSEKALPIWIKLKKINNKVIIETSDDGQVWELLEEKEINFINNHFYIGVYLDPKTFTYYNWLYSNYIQLHCDKYLGTHGNISDVELDMFNGFKKRGNYLINHPFLFTECIEKADILYLTDIMKFIIRSIDNDKYVQLMLNEKYVPDRPLYDRNDFAHLNLVYGYDKNKEILYLMGYNNDGYYIDSEITFENFYLAVSSGIPDADKVKEDYIICISISSPDLKYDINVDLILTFLQDYLNGYNTYKRYDLINSSPNDRIFGIDIYDCFKNYYYSLVYNKRIIHSFIEHKFLMLKRIEYLYNNGIYSEDDYIKLNDIFTSVYKKTDKLRNLLFKESIILILQNKANNKKEKIINLIDEIKEEEIIAFNLLINVLR